MSDEEPVRDALDEAPPRVALVIEQSSESLDLSGRGISNLACIALCSKLIALSLANNVHIRSCDGLQCFSRLWTLDLRGCSLTSIEPLLSLGALAELQLAGNRLPLPSVLPLRSMCIGRLGLQSNTLLPKAARESLGVHAAESTSDSTLLRSFLVDLFPCVVALDESFITSSERCECREYFANSTSGHAMRALLLPTAEASSDAQRQPVTCGGLRAHGRAFERSLALVTLFQDWDVLVVADAQKRTETDARRLRWLAADFDLSLAHSHALRISAVTQEASPFDTTALSLAAIAVRPWLTGARRLQFMCLLALSLYQPIPGQLVQEALTSILTPGMLPEHIATLSRLPPCLRASLLFLLTRRGHDGESSESLWRFLSHGALFLGIEAAPEAPAVGERATAASASYDAGFAQCASTVRRFLRAQPSWTLHKVQPPAAGSKQVAESTAAGTTADTTHVTQLMPLGVPAREAAGADAHGDEAVHANHAALFDVPGLRASPLRSAAKPEHSFLDESRTATPLASQRYDSHATNSRQPHGSANAPRDAPPIDADGSTRWMQELEAQMGADTARQQLGVRGASAGRLGFGLASGLDMPHLDSGQPRLPPPTTLETTFTVGEMPRNSRRSVHSEMPPADSSPTGRSAGLYADNLSWTPSFMLAASGASGRRAGGDDRCMFKGTSSQSHRWSPLDAPAYLLKRRDQTFLHVLHPKPATWVESAPPRAADGSSDEGLSSPSVEALRSMLLNNLHRVIDLFRSLDANGDSKVNATEFRRVLSLVPAQDHEDSSRFAENDADTLFRLLDQDDSGSLDYNELHRMLRQGLSVTLDARLQVGGAGAIEVEARNKLALRGQSPAGSAAPHDSVAGCADTMEPSTVPEGADARGKPSQPRRQLVVSAPIVGPASHMMGKGSMYTLHEDRTWYAVPGKNAFVLQPHRNESLSSFANTPSRLKASVEASRAHVDSYGAIVRSEARAIRRARSIKEFASLHRSSTSRLSLSASQQTLPVRQGGLAHSASLPGVLLGRHDKSCAVRHQCELSGQITAGTASAVGHGPRPRTNTPNNSRTAIDAPQISCCGEPGLSLVDERASVGVTSPQVQRGISDVGSLTTPPSPLLQLKPLKAPQGREQLQLGQPQPGIPLDAYDQQVRLELARSRAVPQDLDISASSALLAERGRKLRQHTCSAVSPTNSSTPWRVSESVCHARSASFASLFTSHGSPR